MGDTTDSGSEGLENVLDVVGLLAAGARGNAAGLLDLIARIDGICDRLAAVRMGLLHGADLVREPGLSVAERLHATNRVSRRTARCDARLARDLADRFPVVAEAWLEGRVSAEQARGIVAGLKRLPLSLSPTQLERCQADVVGFADRFDPDELRTVAERMVEVIDPERAEALEADRVERDARVAFMRRSMVVVPDHHGSMIVRGQLPLADGQLFLAQLQALMPSAVSYGLAGEVPDRAARRADALVRWCAMQAGSGRLPAVGGDRPQVVLTLSLRTLTEGLAAAAVLGSGELLPAGEARRLACDAQLVPAVLGGASEVLDVGRARRFFTGGIRAGLVLRDRGCAFPGCDAPPGACEAHHNRPWWAGGATCLSNGVLLCPYHHRLVEPDPGVSERVQWQILMDPDTGLPWFTPPRQVDPERRPRLHHRFVLGGTSPPTPTRVRECATPADLQPSPSWHG
ncbi:HNH endonuclease signature motif containing protein [Tessaracoccus antarcticus]|uniref:HNH endonuclease n=1 Tax=Tessaracoccus antarcticus TaxID=2479848 RepID=A0A3M0GKN1_9ACTN|nr:HNH endonuclease signature motif containing protein [Tessaracoccus antarcticus]RMB61709.1 HNH endonuclease [Tessaracoccus antarcticus]